MIILVGVFFFPEKPGWVFNDGQMQEWMCVISIGYLTHNGLQIKYILLHRCQFF
jgi:hypothetical protein